MSDMGMGSGQARPPGPEQAVILADEVRESIRRGDDVAQFGALFDQMIALGPAGRSLAVEVAIESVPRRRDPSDLGGVLSHAMATARRTGEPVAATRYATMFAAALINAGEIRHGLEWAVEGMRSADPSVRSDAVAVAVGVAELSGEPTADNAQRLSWVGMAMASVELPDHETAPLSAAISTATTAHSRAIARFALDAARAGHATSDATSVAHLREALRADASLAGDVAAVALDHARRYGFVAEVDALVRDVMGRADGAGYPAVADRIAAEYGTALATSRAPHSAEPHLVRGLRSSDPDVAAIAVTGISSLAGVYGRGSASAAVRDLNRLNEALDGRRGVAGVDAIESAIERRLETAFVAVQREMVPMALSEVARARWDNGADVIARNRSILDRGAHDPATAVSVAVALSEAAERGVLPPGTLEDLTPMMDSALSAARAADPRAGARLTLAWSDASHGVRGSRPPQAAEAHVDVSATAAPQFGTIQVTPFTPAPSEYKPVTRLG